MRGFLLAAASWLASRLALAGARGSAPRPPRVLVAKLDNDINPVTPGLPPAAGAPRREDGYDAIVVELDTPGGLGSSMRKS